MVLTKIQFYPILSFFVEISASNIANIAEYIKFFCGINHQSIKRKMNDSASADLIYKYDNQWPIWALIEVLSFGEFIKLYSMYYEIYKDGASKEIIRNNSS